MDQQDGETTAEDGNDTQKGISRERTFSPEHCWIQLNDRLEDIAQLLSRDMANKKVMAHTITVKVKLHTFDVLSRSKSLRKGVYIQAPEELITVASELLLQLRSESDKKQKDFCCRLLGIRCSSLLHEDSFTNTQQQRTMEKYFTKQPESSKQPKTAKQDDYSEAKLQTTHTPGETPTKSNPIDGDISFGLKTFCDSYWFVYTDAHVCFLLFSNSWILGFLDSELGFQP